jgi:hypothetical protein
MLNVKDMELRDWFAGQALNALIGRERGGERWKRCASKPIDHGPETGQGRPLDLVAG